LNRVRAGSLKDADRNRVLVIEQAAHRVLIGADELGYLIFSLTSRGRTLLANARGNQLGARVTITQTTASSGQGGVSPTPTTIRASANVALVRFS